MARLMLTCAFLRRPSAEGSPGARSITRPKYGAGKRWKTPAPIKYICRNAWCLTGRGAEGIRRGGRGETRLRELADRRWIYWRLEIPGVRDLAAFMRP